MNTDYNNQQPQIANLDLRSICEEFSDGTKKWYRNNRLHREDGPAIE